MISSNQATKIINVEYEILTIPLLPSINKWGPLNGKLLFYVEKCENQRI